MRSVRNTAWAAFSLWLCLGLHAHLALDHTELAHRIFGVVSEHGHHSSPHASAPTSQSEIHCVCDQDPIHDHGQPHRHDTVAVTIPSKERWSQAPAAQLPVRVELSAERSAAAPVAHDLSVPQQPVLAAKIQPRAPPLA